ncbi:hypothetical protein MLD38_003865 [Melastoma candidum]|uniref:Uncharacterized protein n=1 Tax=Melastoma candidum TaxID=119954 RepID=A0ACB9S593_9MYRT|nr:hypothetical protein MLD38_003865 [Melastoma candidum]
MLLNKQRKGAGAQGEKGGIRFLISVTVLGSAGPIRLVVKEEQLVGSVIDTVLKSYAREGRLPVLGSNLDEFMLYSLNHGSDALNPWETIGTNGARNFLLCKKQKMDTPASDRNSTMERKASWKAWLNKSFNRRISSH